MMMNGPMGLGIWGEGLVIFRQLGEHWKLFYRIVPHDGFYKIAQTVPLGSRVLDDKCLK